MNAAPDAPALYIHTWIKEVFILQRSGIQASNIKEMFFNLQTKAVFTLLRSKRCSFIYDQSNVTFRIRGVLR